MLSVSECKGCCNVSEPAEGIGIKSVTGVHKCVLRIYGSMYGSWELVIAEVLGDRTALRRDDRAIGTGRMVPFESGLNGSMDGSWEFVLAAVLGDRSSLRMEYMSIGDCRWLRLQSGLLRSMFGSW